MAQCMAYFYRWKPKRSVLVPGGRAAGPGGGGRQLGARPGGGGGGPGGARGGGSAAGQGEDRTGGTGGVGIFGTEFCCVLIFFLGKCCGRTGRQ